LQILNQVILLFFDFDAQEFIIFSLEVQIFFELLINHLQNGFSSYPQRVLTSDKLIFQIHVGLGDHFCPQRDTLVLRCKRNLVLIRAFVFTFEAVSD